GWEVARSCSVPGLTARQDSEKFELYWPARQVPGTGAVWTGGMGYPPPADGWLTTVLVVGTLEPQSCALAESTLAPITPTVRTTAMAILRTCPPVQSWSPTLLPSIGDCYT